MQPHLTATYPTQTRKQHMAADIHYLSSVALDTGAEGAPDFPEKAATCFFTAAKPLLFCRDPISVYDKTAAGEERGGGRFAFIPS